MTAGQGLFIGGIALIVLATLTGAASLITLGNRKRQMETYLKEKY